MFARLSGVQVRRVTVETGGLLLPPSLSVYTNLGPIVHFLGYPFDTWTKSRVDWVKRRPCCRAYYGFVVHPCEGYVEGS